MGKLMVVLLVCLAVGLGWLSASHWRNVGKSVEAAFVPCRAAWIAGCADTTSALAETVAVSEETKAAMREAEDAGRRAFDAQQQARRDLFWALRSRVLTDEEMQEVSRHGTYLNVEMGQSYRPEEKLAELNAALLTQAILRLGSKSPAK